MNSRRTLSEWLIGRGHPESVPVYVDEFLWGSLLAPAPEPAIPSGFHDSSTVARLIEQRALFTGLVVSIGAPKAVGGMQNFLMSLMRPEDLACREQDDELLLICPATGGVKAQQHLISLSERLWDFQLRSRKNCPALLSIAGSEIRREPIGQGIALARERMKQTRRQRADVISCQDPE